MKAVLEYVKNEDKVSKEGKPYTSCSIKIRGRYYNGFGDEVTKTWRKGQSVDVDLWEDEYNGKPVYRFAPMEPDESSKIVKKLEQRVTAIEKFLKKKFMPSPPKDETGTPPSTANETKPAETKTDADPW